MSYLRARPVCPAQLRALSDGTSLATHLRVKERPESGEAVSAGPRDPATRERSVNAEPTVILAQGVVAFDEWGHALGARVADRRAQADTIPAEDERGPIARATFHQTVYLLLAAAFLLGTASLLVRSTGSGEAPEARAATVASLSDREQTAALRPVFEVATQPTPLTPADVAPAAARPPPPPLPPEPARAEVPSPRGHAAAERAAAPRRTRVAPAAKPKRNDIVRDNPF